MNAVEIEEAISQLAEQPFDAVEFPYDFLLAFGNKETTLKRLRSGTSNKSDLDGVLQANNIHLKSCAAGNVSETLAALKSSPATTKAKAKFILATDGQTLEAEDLTNGDTIACDFKDFPDHFGFFLPLAGISTVKQIRESSFDIKATGRLNRLYVELLKTNPDWGTAERRHDMNHFMARLIFLFFAEDTSILNGEDLFTATVTQMSDKDSSNTHEVISELFRAMNTKIEDRATANLPRWADTFPYVNGGLFSGSTEAPKFSKIARSYLLHIGSLDWTKINPDIFGSMIQAVADDEERGALGMHYTSVPNILKVLNPLFLDDLNAQLDAAGDNKRKLDNLRKRMSKIRVFDPACGSGNFLVIAYKEMRAIEAKINAYCGEPDRRSEIPLTNFRGIELRDFPAEIARLALIIAEYQCDVTYRGHKDALAAFLPLDAENWITQGNALRLDWLTVCPPTSQKVDMRGEDLFMSPLEKAQIDFKNEGGETYICGNPPYVGATTKAPKGASRETKERLKKEDARRKEDMRRIFEGRSRTWKSLDYVSGWFMKAADFGQISRSAAAFVTTNSVCQGQQVPILWPLISQTGHEISFAHTSFVWSNLASNNAGVTVAIVGIEMQPTAEKRLYSIGDDGSTSTKSVENINAYLVPYKDVIVQKSNRPLSELTTMVKGSAPTDGGNLLLKRSEVEQLALGPTLQNAVRRFMGSEDSINGGERYCLWLRDKSLDELLAYDALHDRLEAVRLMRLESSKEQTKKFSETPHLFVETRQTGREQPIVIPRHSSERRRYLPCAIGTPGSIVADSAAALLDAPLWNVAVLSSRLHLVWIATVCGKIKTDYRYSNTLGWNTFPVPKLTEKNKEDLTRCAEDILLAREAHFPATIADLYKPDAMPENLRAAHERNDEVLERIYIGRRFRNDTERLEKLFELYTKMTTKVAV
ncbi:class I SAM-dependent DNA methyltransferase [Phaeobacter inhibens]|uniref:class I SAM-dependent DNA methyltransferase n=1 Tax=Phaeobacter inhibens TaxID=221822 RepID=UPI0021A74384|nr:DNA methyltransferase [Phaeobacter inhibens]UWR87124.1 lactate dehydrogenase [Phaeobacter inhibens]